MTSHRVHSLSGSSMSASLHTIAAATAGLYSLPAQAHAAGRLPAQFPTLPGCCESRRYCSAACCARPHLDSALPPAVLLPLRAQQGSLHARPRCVGRVLHVHPARVYGHHHRLRAVCLPHQQTRPSADDAGHAGCELLRRRTISGREPLIIMLSTRCPEQRLVAGWAWPVSRAAASLQLGDALRSAQGMLCRVLQVSDGDDRPHPGYLLNASLAALLPGAHVVFCSVHCITPN